MKRWRVRVVGVSSSVTGKVTQINPHEILRTERSKKAPERNVRLKSKKTSKMKSPKMKNPAHTRRTVEKKKKKVQPREKLQKKVRRAKKKPKKKKNQFEFFDFRILDKYPGGRKCEHHLATEITEELCLGKVSLWDPTKTYCPSCQSKAKLSEATNDAGLGTVGMSAPWKSSEFATTTKIWRCSKCRLVSCLTLKTKIYVHRNVEGLFARKIFGDPPLSNWAKRKRRMAAPKKKSVPYLPGWDKELPEEIENRERLARAREEEENNIDNVPYICEGSGWNGTECKECKGPLKLVSINGGGGYTGKASSSASVYCPKCSLRFYCYSHSD